MTISQFSAVGPQRLASGDTIGIVAPSSPFDKTSFRRGIDAIRQMGFKTKIDERAYAGEGYLAGEDPDRADQLNTMFADDAVQAVMCARGGYGALRILDRLDYQVVKANPKPFIGFSDITALHQAFWVKCGLVTFHGPTVTTLWQSDEISRESWFKVLTGTPPAPVPVPDGAFLRPGTAEGELVGGNLTVLSHLIGTPYWVPLEDKVLFIEDTAEAPYRIDRMLFQMKMIGLLDGLAGVVLGTFERCGDLDRIGRAVQSVLEGMDIPIASGMPFGHGARNLTLPLGAPVRLDGDAGELSFPGFVLGE